jgi:signal transduction histidine kinase/ligand-binding sensor domain-containing protein/CheY-like chemotaxis protein/AraC-like DNA-binding protein
MPCQLTVHRGYYSLLILIASVPLFAQSNATWFRRLSVEHGLASTHVTSIVQDHKGFLWFGTWKGLCRYDGYTIKTYRQDPDDSLSLHSDGIMALLVDRRGNLWVGTNKGLDRFNRDTETFTPVFKKTTDPAENRKNSVFALCEDKAGNIWVGTRNGLHRFNPDTKSLTHYQNNLTDPYSLSENHILSLCPGQNGLLWIGTMNGLNRFDPRTGRCTRFMHNPEDTLSPATISHGRVGTIAEGPDGTIYIGTRSGLDIYNPQKNGASFRHVPLAVSNILRDSIDGSWWLGTSEGLHQRSHIDSADVALFKSDRALFHSLSSASITCLFQDKEGSLWIGTENGINILTPEARQFRHYKNNPADSNSLANNLIYCVYEGKDGLVWLGTNEGGLNCLNPKTGFVQRYPAGDGQSYLSTNSSTIFRVYEDRQGNIWAGSPNNGLDRLDRRTNTFTHFKWGDIRDLISFYFEDNQNTLWIGHQGGVSRYDPITQQFEFAHYAPENAGKGMLGVVTGMLQDHTGTYWVSSNGYSLNRFDPIDLSYQRFEPDPDNPGSIISNNVQAIYEDKKGQLWVGTDKGLNLYDRTKGSFRHFSTKDGLPDLMMGHLLEDGKGYLWIATGVGISRFDPQTETFRNFDTSDGLSSNESWDFIKSPNTGAFLLATADGLTIFHPDSLRDNNVAPSIVFTKFTRFDVHTGKEVEEKGIDEKTTLKLSYKDDLLVFEFAALSFRKTDKNQYAYKLEGLHEDWVPLGNKRELTFTNLKAGSYILRVKASNGDGIWNETGAALRIKVKPPLWATWWARAVYALLVFGLIRWAYRFQLSRKLAAAENLRLKELDAVKTRLYTNITHEFRTPLTVISGIADQLKENPGRWLEEGPEIIARNSQNLLDLVNQMLELRKLEAGMMPLHAIQGDIILYLKYLFESFHSYAESKRITLTIESQLDQFVMDFDPDKMLAILSNLLSNAIKFTPAGGAVTLKIGAADPNHLQLIVQDNGIGIPAQEMPYIFDRFHQVDGTNGGTGIGLTLTRELVHLMGGKINVDSTYGEGAVFTVTLPVSRQAAPAKSLPGLRSKTQSHTTLTATSASDSQVIEQPLVQIVEDNADVVLYLRACLEADYRLVIAPNGKAGLEQAFADIPDLLISDVMMPEMDGFELCQRLKADERTNHIPIILLTARADADSRLQGIRHGADAYMAKPFHKEELLLQIQNLLTGRRVLQAHYLALAAQPSAATAPVTEENAFVLKARAIVEVHLNNHHFDVEQFCREIGMSNSNLHRKLSALTGRSANQFIRYIRLSKACELLKDPEQTIAAIADDCGFNDPVYFTRAFKQEFGVTPSEWRGR